MGSNNKVLAFTIIAASIVFIVGTAVGALAIPIILAVIYSRYWLILYVFYAFVALRVVFLGRYED